MSLRLRLTLFYTLLVAVILAASGLALHYLLQRSLSASFNQSMLESSQIIRATLEAGEFEYDNRELELHIDPSTFPNEQTALIFDRAGNLKMLLGGKVEGITELVKDLNPGFNTKDSWRIYIDTIGLFTIALLKNTEAIHHTLSQFDRLVLLLLPLALVLSFVLGYALAKQALSPVDRMTKEAYSLAERRAWRESLPEPAVKDELWRLSQATNTLLAALKDVIETERRFTADAAHELRTPITVLQGRLEQVLEETKEPQSRARLLKAHGAAEHLLTLVEKLLLLARTEAGQGLQKEKLALDEVAFHSAEQLRPLFGKQGLELITRLPEQPVWVKGDRLALELLIKNLLENALKFTPEGCVTIRVKVQNDLALLSVEDQGPGIPEAVQDKLFDRFYQTEVSHRQMGSGLGLALVKSIADWHGARIKVTNLARGGSCFSLTLPLIKA
ncbi:MAG: HAMP domain-containing histidine kinase [Trueperaceae bacterium]|nr:HAMP domain-containing histidine kinase [Trueperaceae bacterium]